MNLRYCICFILFIYGCEVPQVESNNFIENTYIVNLDTIFQLGSTTETTVEVYTNIVGLHTFIFNDTNYLLEDNGNYNLNGDFLKDDQVFSTKIDLENILGNVSSTPFILNIDGKSFKSGKIHVIDTVLFSEAYISSITPSYVLSNLDSQFISISVDSNKMESNKITKISYVKLSSNNNELWSKKLKSISNTSFGVDVSNIDMVYGIKDSTEAVFAFKFESSFKSEYVNTHSVLLRNEKPIFLDDSIFNTKIVNSTKILPVEVSVSNLEGLNEIDRVYILSQSGNPIQFHNDGSGGNDRTAFDHIWRVELNVSTADPGHYSFSGYIVDKGGNISDEFIIEFDL